MKTLKQFRPIELMLIAASLLLIVGILLFPSPAKAGKAKATSAALELDKGYSLAVGQRGFYQLEDDEGGVSFNQFGQLEPGGRKVPAILTAVQVARNEDGSLKFNERGGLIPERSADGTIVVCVHVLRPANKGGAFDKCGAEYGSRESGGFDIVQPPDLVGF